MSGVFQTIKDTGLLVVAACGGWVAGYKIGSAEARGEDLNDVVCDIIGHRIVAVFRKDGFRKRVSTYYWEAQMVVALERCPGWKPLGRAGEEAQGEPT